MTTPITGPFSKVEYLNGPPTNSGYKPVIWWRNRATYRQKRPYDRPLNFGLIEKIAVQKAAWNDLTGYDPNVAPDVSTVASTYPPILPGALSKARNKFKEAVGANVNLAVALAERKQSMDMITNRSMQLFKFTRALLRGKFGDAAKALGCSMPPIRKVRPLKRTRDGGLYKRDLYRPKDDPSFEGTGLRKGAKYFANNYLEFHFGWSPLLSDIYDAAEVLSSPIPPTNVIRATGYEHSVNEQNTLEESSSLRAYRKRVNDYQQHVVLGANVVVSNPNLALAQQCGLINPLTVAWELVPFSFVLDWFVTVGEFLDQFTEFAGLTLSNQFYTVFTRFTYSESATLMYNPYAPPADYPDNPNWRNQKYGGGSREVYKKITHDRTVGAFPSGNISVRGPWTMSPRRGLAAVSLLCQGLSSGAPRTARKVASLSPSEFKRRLFPEAYLHL